MEIKDWMMFVAFFSMFLLLLLSLIHINSFMKSEVKCESGFEVINKCGCIPDEGMARIFHRPWIGLNLTNLQNGTE